MDTSSSDQDSSKTEIEKLRREVDALKLVRPEEIRHIIYSIHRLTTAACKQAAKQSGPVAAPSISSSSIPQDPSATPETTPEARPNLAREQKIDPWSVSSAVDAQGMSLQSFPHSDSLIC